MSGLVRVLSAPDSASDSCYVSTCDVDPTFVVSTPYGPHSVCESHLDGLVASLTPEFVAQWEKRPEPIEDLQVADGIPF